MSYLPVTNLLKGYFEITEKDSLQTISDKVKPKVLALDGALAPTLPALLALLDAPVNDLAWQTLDPTERRRRMLDGVRYLLLQEARQRPLLLFFEDLHWIDDETQAVLDSLVEDLGSGRVLLLATYRPEYQHGWAGKTYYSQLRLDALAGESGGQLLDALLGYDPTLSSLKQLLANHGNPFFLEEAVRTLVETKALEGSSGSYRLTRPIEAVQVPATVQVILASRIDRLSPEDKHLLQIAAVMGRSVPFSLLRVVAELPDEVLRGALDRLQAAEFVYETGLFPDVEYTFKHALTQDVAYGGLLQERRRELHARVVDAIETLHHNRLGEQIEVLAHHALRGDLREKAVDYLRQAGLKAVARSASLDARTWFEEALKVLDTLPESPPALEAGFDIRLELRPVLNVLGALAQVVERLREAEGLAERLNDDRRRGQVCGFSTNAHVILGELDEALMAGTRSLEIAGRLGDLRLRFVSTHFIEQAHFYRGEYERVIELATVSLAAMPVEWAYEHFGLLAPASVFHLGWLTRSLGELDKFAEASAYDTEALRLAEPTHHAWALGMIHYNSGYLLLLKGDWTQARERLEKSIAANRMGNFGLALPYILASSAWALAQLGESSEALSRARESEKLAEPLAARGAVVLSSLTYHALGRACLALGRLDEAQRQGNRAGELFPGHDGYAPYVLHLLGDIATHYERFDAARGEDHYRQALALAEPRGMRPLIAHCHLGLGKFSRRTGRQEQAREHLATATAMYREMDMRFYKEQAEAESRLVRSPLVF